MTATTDPFDRTLGDWLASLEADEPAGLQAHVVEDARSSAQRRGWLARADLAVVLAPRTGSPSGTGVALVIVGAMLAVITVGLLAGGRVVPTVPAPVPSLVPGPSTALIAPVVPAGSWEPVDSPGIPPGGLALTDAVLRPDHGHRRGGATVRPDRRDVDNDRPAAPRASITGRRWSSGRQGPHRGRAAHGHEIWARQPGPPSSTAQGRTAGPRSTRWPRRAPSE